MATRKWPGSSLPANLPAAFHVDCALPTCRCHAARNPTNAVLEAAQGTAPGTAGAAAAATATTAGRAVVIGRTAATTPAALHEADRKNCTPPRYPALILFFPSHPVLPVMPSGQIEMPCHACTSVLPPSHAVCANHIIPYGMPCGTCAGMIMVCVL